MAVTAQAGVYSFGPQPSKGVIAPTFYRHKAVDVDLGVQDDTRLGQLEIGGLPTPTFPYKAGYVIGGGATLQPRMEDTFGWLLYGALGKVTTTAVVGATAAKDHKFEMSADGTAVPWMSMRKYIPPNSGDMATDLGETYKDLKVLGLAFQVSTDQPLTCRVDSLGREFALDDAGGAWTYGNTYEDFQSIPVGCATDGFIKVDGVEMPVVQATFAWQNQPLDIRQEKIIGTPMIDDVTVITRQLSVDLVVKYNNPDLYRQVLTGASNGTAWTPQPFTAPVDLTLVSTDTMPGETNMPYSLRCQAASVNLQMVGSIRLGAGQAIMMRFQGVALDDGSGNYASFTLRNLKTAYTWPT